MNAAARGEIDSINPNFGMGRINENAKTPTCSCQILDVWFLFTKARTKHQRRRRAALRHKTPGNQKTDADESAHNAASKTLHQSTG
jgi:hypothetical protein